MSSAVSLPARRGPTGPAAPRASMAAGRAPPPPPPAPASFAPCVCVCVRVQCGRARRTVFFWRRWRRAVCFCRLPRAPLRADTRSGSSRRGSCLRGVPVVAGEARARALCRRAKCAKHWPCFFGGAPFAQEARRALRKQASASIATHSTDQAAAQAPVAALGDHAFAFAHSTACVGPCMMRARSGVR